MIGILLCGGAGRRVAGADKPLLNWRGRPMFAQVLTRLQPQVESVVISANRNRDIYAQHADVVADRWPDYQGPLVGIASVIQEQQEIDYRRGSDSVYLVCPGDMPSIPLDLGERLDDNRSLDEVRYAYDGKRPQPLCMVCGDRHLPSMLQYLNQGERSVHGWLESVDAQPVMFNDARAFHNCNQPDDFTA